MKRVRHERRRQLLGPNLQQKLGGHGVALLPDPILGRNEARPETGHWAAAAVAIWIGVENGTRLHVGDDPLGPEVACIAEVLVPSDFAAIGSDDMRRLVCRFRKEVDGGAKP